MSPIVCAHAAKSLNPLHGTGSRPLESLKGTKVFCFSGIATPESFENLLKKAGATIVGLRRYTDHYSYEPEDIEQILKAAEQSGAAMMVTTEKDAVRLPILQTKLPAYYLRMEVDILSGARDFHEAVDTICFHSEPNSAAAS